MLNPRLLSWDHTTQFVDGTEFNAAHFAGYELAIDGKPTVVLPVQWVAGSRAEYPVQDLDLSNGAHTLAVRTIARNGSASDFSNEVSFEIDRRVPKRPTLAVQQ